jgi:MoaA/NifB/PqqE/SkfB family radical SAM enzyme
MSAVPPSPPSVPCRDLSFLWLEITAKCNLQCVHCYAESGPQLPLFGGMSTEKWLEVLADAASLGCRQVQFIGGEPTLHPDLARMISFASAKGYSFIEVFTNATHVDDHLLRTLVEHGISIAVSFYSDDPLTHDSITKRRGSFDRTLENLRRMVSAGLPLRAGVIEMHENAGHSPKAKLLLESIGVRDVKVDIRRNVGRGAAFPTPSEPMEALCGECWKGKLCVTSSRRIYPCVFSRFADLGSIDGGIGTILEGDPLLDFRVAFKNYCDDREAKGRLSAVEEQISRRGASPFEPSVVESPPLVPLQETCRPTCAPCGPDDFIECAPGGPSPCNPSCGPLAKCMPSAVACGPEQTCGPTRSCLPLGR